MTTKKNNKFVEKYTADHLIISIQLPIIVKNLVGAAIPYFLSICLLNYLQFGWWTSETISELFHYVNLFIYDIDTFDQITILTNIEKLKVGIITGIFLCIILTFDYRYYIFPYSFIEKWIVSVCLWNFIFCFFFIATLTVLKSQVELSFTVDIKNGFFSNGFAENTLLMMRDLANTDLVFVLVLLHAVFFGLEIWSMIVFIELNRAAKFNKNLGELPGEVYFQVILIGAFWYPAVLFLNTLIQFEWELCSYVYTTLKNNKVMPGNGPHWGFLLPHVKETLYQLSLDSVSRTNFWAASNFHCSICNDFAPLFDYLKNRSEAEWPRIYNFYVENGAPAAHDLMISERKQWVVDFYKESDVCHHHQKEVDPKTDVEKYIEHRRKLRGKVFAMYGKLDRRI